MGLSHLYHIFPLEHTSQSDFRYYTVIYRNSSDWYNTFTIILITMPSGVCDNAICCFNTLQFIEMYLLYV